MQNKNPNTILLTILIILVLGFGVYLSNKGSDKEVLNENPPVIQVKDTYTYTNHGFSIELPKGYVPSEMEGEGGPTLSIGMPNNSAVVYVMDADFWEKVWKDNPNDFKYIKDEKIGNSTFKLYTYSNQTYYWLRKGKVGYELHGDKENFSTFKFVGWPKEESTKNTTFIDSLIKKGVDRIYKYSYEEKTYYYTMDWEVIGADGTPEVYSASGTKIDCRFGSPMAPVTSETPPMNPICKDYASGVIIYERK